MYTARSLQPLKPHSRIPSADELFHEFRINFPIDQGWSGSAPVPSYKPSDECISEESRYVEEAELHQHTREPYWADPGAQLDQTCPILAELLSFTQEHPISEPTSTPVESPSTSNQRTLSDAQSFLSSFDTSIACAQSAILNGESNPKQDCHTQPIDLDESCLQARPTSAGSLETCESSSDVQKSIFTFPPARSECPTRLTEVESYQFGTDDRFTEDGFNVPPPIDNLFSNSVEQHQMVAKWIVSIMQNTMQLPSAVELDGRSEKARPNTSAWKQRYRWAPRGQKEESSYADLGANEQIRRDSLDKSDNGRKVGDRRTLSGKRKASPPSTSSPKPTLKRLERLAPEQKRKNHINCEQKRRAGLKTSFSELNNLVPELRLRGGRVNISNALIEAAIFLDLLVNTNAELRRRMRLVGRG
jgi:hypothetical protein